MNKHNLDEMSEKVAEICYYNDEDVEQIRSLYLRITHDEKDILDLEVFYNSFQIPTQELYENIFSKYNKIRWNSFFQIVSILCFGRLDLLLPFTMLINGIFSSDTFINEKQFERFMRCIGLESEIGPFLKHFKLRLPISYNILQTHLAEYNILKNHLYSNQSYLRSFIFPKRKAQEIVNRYINLESRYNYKITHRGQSPTQTCLHRLMSCFSSENSIYSLKDCANFDYEVPIPDIERNITQIVFYFQMLFFPNSNIPSNDYHLPNRSIQIIKKQGSTYSIALTPRSFSRMKNHCSCVKLNQDCSKCSRVFESYRFNYDTSASFINKTESKCPIKSTGISLVSNDFGNNYRYKSFCPSNSIVPEEKVCEINVKAELYTVSPKSPKSPKCQ